MRTLFALVAALLLTLATASGANAAAPPRLDLTAQSVSFYYDRFLVVADGDVRLRMSDGTVVRGETFSMDLKQNRFLVAGDVRLDGPQVHKRGAALARFIDEQRTYFIDAESVPDRLTYFGDDWSDPHAGREQPGDAFAFTDTGVERPYVLAKGARIFPRTNAIFDGARIRELNVYVPLGRYVVTFAQNPNFQQNALAGARFDVGVPFTGSEHSLTAVHLRNDATNGTYLSLDQHFAWDRDWIAASINPVTEYQRQINVIGLKTISPAIQARLFTQLTTAQHALVTKPTNAAAFTELQIAAGLPHSGLLLSYDFYYYWLLGIGPNDDDPQHREHPVNGQLVWNGFQQRIPFTPFYYRLRSGIGYAHDVNGYGGYPNLDPAPHDAWYDFVGATLYSPEIRLGRLFTLTTSIDQQTTRLTGPHTTFRTESRVTLARRFNNKVNAFVSYDVANIRDLWGENQLAAYPPLANQVTTAYGTFDGLEAFRGLGTTRQLGLDTVVNLSAYTTFTFFLTHNVDSPAPVPGYFGQPPWQVAFDLRTRISRFVQVDLTRSYYFNFADQRWSPQLGIQFSP